MVGKRSDDILRAGTTTNQKAMLAVEGVIFSEDEGEVSHWEESSDDEEETDGSEERIAAYLDRLCHVAGGGYAELYQIETYTDQYSKTEASFQLLASSWSDNLYEWSEDLEDEDGEMKTSGLSFMLCQTLLADNKTVWVTCQEGLATGLDCELCTVVAGMPYSDGTVSFIAILFSPHVFRRTPINERLIGSLLLFSHNSGEKHAFSLHQGEEKRLQPEDENRDLLKEETAKTAGAGGSFEQQLAQASSPSENFMQDIFFRPC
mmetsp:Transcript_10275/g.17517  ORF Transcript_10275/g.17517 Transcript_10275/m.17517 type:complete len:262 (-) Transcript_10275:4-789(-)